jgi:hypothetical protein
MYIILDTIIVDNYFSFVGSRESHMSLSRRYLFNIMDEYPSKNFVEKCNYLKNRVIEMTNSDKWSDQIKHILSRFTSELKTKWIN